MKNILLIILLGFGLNLSAQYGTIDTKAVVKEAKAVQTIQVTFDSLQKELNVKLNMKVAVYQDRQKTAQAQKSSGALSPNQEKALVEELQKLSDEINKFQQDEFGKLNEAQTAKMVTFVEEMKTATKKVAKAAGIEAVFDINAIVWIDAKDLTQDLIKELNK